MDGHFLWPGYRDNLRPLLWLMQLKNGEVKGRPTAVGIIPTKDELELDGVDISPKDLETILSINVPRWRQEIAHRVNLKFAPDVRFRMDRGLDAAAKIDALLRLPQVQRDLKHDQPESGDDEAE